MSRIHIREFTVPEAAMDVNRHVNNLEYLRWMQDVAVEHSVTRGWPLERYRAARVVWVVRSHTIEYLRPAFAGDELRLATWVADLRPRSSLRRYLFWRESDREVVARAETLWVLVHLDTGRATSLPADLRGSFVAVAGEEEVLRRLRRATGPAAPAADREAADA